MSPPSFWFILAFEKVVIGRVWLVIETGALNPGPPKGIRWFFPELLVWKPEGNLWVYTGLLTPPLKFLLASSLFWNGWYSSFSRWLSKTTLYSLFFFFVEMPFDLFYGTMAVFGRSKAPVTYLKFPAPFAQLIFKLLWKSCDCEFAPWWFVAPPLALEPYREIALESLIVPVPYA